jgi:hypothetical protein
MRDAGLMSSGLKSSARVASSPDHSVSLRRYSARGKRKPISGAQISCKVNWVVETPPLPARIKGKVAPIISHSIFDGISGAREIARSQRSCESAVRRLPR